ncbi:hypothetical protein AEAC466_01795 [Asticcacaulis sp. AC466]|uniref:hypothetical protein n=1 Tax=Asticcacaulis sp. AC466 TaxID=1282362 RepID=UPI0003C3E6C4|nr:hypothetical protein [Asticcacaulis sp. AC466]ESQ85939.1 hypothetical protein AEAC466_01795 [Asticcacaulis sp. AC466]
MMPPRKSRFVMLAALAAVASVAISACGKLGTLEQAPPIMNKKAEQSWSASKNADGGVTLTTDSSSSRASERATPDADSSNSMENPYTVNKRIADAPLEGFGNNTQVVNSPTH